jgi:UDP-N-acetylmuramyl pentapeptide synthase
MKINIFRAMAIAAAIGIATTAFAAGLDGLEYQTERTVKLKSGKVVTVIVGKMNGKMMAIVPMEEYNELFLRAEGHSMSD